MARPLRGAWLTEESVGFTGGRDFTFFCRRLPDAFVRHVAVPAYSRPDLAAMTTADVLLFAPSFLMALLI